MATDPPKPPRPLETVGQIFTVLAGAAIFVYVVGGVLMWVRLRAEGLPGGAAVSPLPRELLVTVALRDVVGPALLLASLAAVLVVLTRTWKKRRSAISRREQQFLRWLGRIAAALLLVVALGFAVLFAGGVWKPWESHNVIPFFFWFLGLVLVGFVVPFITLRSGLAERGSFLLIGTVALFVGLTATGVRVLIDAWNPELEFARVCVNDRGGLREGHLIGQTSEAIYIGLKAQRQIVVVPASRIEEVWIGDREGLPTCN